MLQIVEPFSAAKVHVSCDSLSSPDDVGSSSVLWRQDGRRVTPHWQWTTTGAMSGVCVVPVVLLLY